MNMDKATTGNIAASGTLVSGPAEVTALGFVSSGTGTVKFRDGGYAGVVRWGFAAATGTSVGLSFTPPLRFKNDVYAEIASGVAYIAIVNPQANQI